MIGGSGFYSFLDDVTEVPVTTPFGAPSEQPVVGTVAGRRVAFMPRHGRDHRIPPHQVNYRANLWALRAVGVRQVVAPCAVGSLRPELGPGTVVVPDQVVDRTWGRDHTVYDTTGPVVHVGFADPFCPRGRTAVLSASTGSRTPGALGEAVDGGTLVVVNGPRFSSRAESRWHAAAGWSLVGMTTMPEAAIARELALCFTTVALVTDHDAGVEGGEAVTHQEVLAVFARNVEALKSLVGAAIETLPHSQGDCVCGTALDGLDSPLPAALTTGRDVLSLSWSRPRRRTRAPRPVGRAGRVACRARRWVRRHRRPVVALLLAGAVAVTVESLDVPATRGRRGVRQHRRPTGGPPRRAGRRGRGVLPPDAVPAGSLAPERLVGAAPLRSCS